MIQNKTDCFSLRKRILMAHSLRCHWTVATFETKKTENEMKRNEPLLTSRFLPLLDFSKQTCKKLKTVDAKPVIIFKFKCA